MSGYAFRESVEVNAADGSALSHAPWLTVDGVEIPPVRIYARRNWWQRLLRRPAVQTRWATGAFTMPEQEVAWVSGGSHTFTAPPAGAVVVELEFRPAR